jgi:hypothetical protein
LNKEHSGFRDICKECGNAKDHMGGGCYCLQYGIIIGYPKMWCVGFKERTNDHDGNDGRSNGEHS